MIPRLLTHAIDVIKGKAPVTVMRHPQWPTLRKQHLLKEPECQVCGRTNWLEVHHVEAFSDAPEKEMLPSNLITLCDPPMGLGKFGIRSCHRLFGHFGHWGDINPSVRNDAMIWGHRFSDRGP